VTHVIPRVVKEVSHAQERSVHPAGDMQRRDL
jgi:hypothetical protein